jgi:hypothetical protein
MSDFVEQCRREWERLRVPAPVANEMAADLAADLEEAEAEGVSAEEVLGRSAFDPRSFAASWATERGVIPSAIPTAPRQESASRTLLLAALATLAASGLIVAALIALPGRSRSVAMAPTPHLRVSVAPPASSGPLVLHGGPYAADALAWILLVLVAILGVIGAGWLWSRWVRLRPPTAPA